MTQDAHINRQVKFSDHRLHSFYARRLKRVVDLTLCFILVPLILPTLAVLFVLVRLDGGPGFFGHRRMGRDGRYFYCWKIRTMVPDAQSLLRKHLAENPEAAAEWRNDFKLRDDPRVTRIGALLRASSLDELPQIWNVLRGEMSFVGPRPITRDELERYNGYEWSYLSVSPGVTGLWQVSGRNSVSYDERVSLDVQYASRCSLLMDLFILLRTMGVVMKRTGL